MKEMLSALADESTRFSLSPFQTWKALLTSITGAWRGAGRMTISDWNTHQPIFLLLLLSLALGPSFNIHMYGSVCATWSAKQVWECQGLSLIQGLGLILAFEVTEEHGNWCRWRSKERSWGLLIRR